MLANVFPPRSGGWVKVPFPPGVLLIIHLGEVLALHLAGPSPRGRLAQLRAHDHQVLVMHAWPVLRTSGGVLFSHPLLPIAGTEEMDKGYLQAMAHRVFLPGRPTCFFTKKKHKKNHQPSQWRSFDGVSCSPSDYLRPRPRYAATLRLRSGSSCDASQKKKTPLARNREAAR